MEQEIETMNDHLIGMQGDLITVMIPPTRMSVDEALRFAAWIVAMADASPSHTRFEAVLRAVENT
jgi:hypothetical protein